MMEILFVSVLKPALRTAPSRKRDVHQGLHAKVGRNVVEATEVSEPVEPGGQRID